MHEFVGLKPHANPKKQNDNFSQFLNCVPLCKADFLNVIVRMHFQEVFSMLRNCSFLTAPASGIW
jgi:hypothetical protein